MHDSGREPKVLNHQIQIVQMPYKLST